MIGSRGLVATRLLFLAWLLSIPFFSFSLIGTLSVDNILVPVLLLLGLATRLRLVLESRLKVAALFLLVAFVASQALAVVDSPEVFWSSTYFHARRTLYAAIPIFFVCTRRDLDLTSAVLVLVTMIAALSAALAALGLVDLPLQRFEESRLGIQWLRKSIGLFPSYGDLAILSAYVGAMVFAMNRAEFPLGRGGAIPRVLVLGGLLVGFTANQSRSVVLCFLLMLALLAAITWFHRSQRVVRVLTIGAFVVLALLVAGVFRGQVAGIVAGLGGLGGEQAAGNVSFRLEQYGFALRALEDGFFFGVSGKALAAQQETFATVHNLWLVVALQSGMVGVGLLAATLLLPLPALFGNSKADGRARCALAAMAASALASQFYPGLTETFWLMAGVAVAVGAVTGRGADANAEASRRSAT